MVTITIVDESTMGQQRSWDLALLDETISLRELIQRRVYQEVSEFNARQAELFQGLVQPTDAERTLNGSYRLRNRRALDWEVQYEKAVEAFGKRSYIVLVDERQVSDLNAAVELHAGTAVTFLKLVPLVGG